MSYVKQTSVVLIDADEPTAKILEMLCDGMRFSVMTTLRQANHRIPIDKPDLLIINPKMPDGDGIELVKTIRGWSNVPIIALSDQIEDVGAVDALQAGADDFVSKPFNASVLMARMGAALRKGIVRDVGESSISHGPIHMDLVRHKCTVDGEEVKLTPKEWDILRFFMINRGRMLSHKQILSEVWGPAQKNETQYLRVFIGNVREKLDSAGGNTGRMIRSESGVGYILEGLPAIPAGKASRQGRRQTGPEATA